MSWHTAACWFGIVMTGTSAIFSIVWFDRFARRGLPLRNNVWNLAASAFNLGLLFWNSWRLRHG